MILWSFHPLNLGISFGCEVIKVVLIRVIPKLPYIPSTKTSCFKQNMGQHVIYNIKMLQNNPVSFRVLGMKCGLQETQFFCTQTCDYLIFKLQFNTKPQGSSHPEPSKVLKISFFPHFPLSFSSLFNDTHYIVISKFLTS